MKRLRSRTMTLMRKEWLQIIRDPRTFITALLNPMMMLFLYGYGLSTDIKDVRLGVVDWSHTSQSRNLHRAFTSSRYFKDAFESQSYEALGRALDDRTIQIGLVIPADFARTTAAGRGSAVQIIVDGSDPTTANTVSGYASAIVSGQSQTALRSYATRRGISLGQGAIGIDARPRVWYNEDLQSINFIVPGVIVIVLMMTTASLTASTVARERERGSIEQIVVSPVKPYELMVGKTAAYVALALIDVALVVIVGHFWFGVPIKGSLLLFGLSSLLFVTSALGIGLLASAGASSQRAAQTSVMLFTMLPSIILSGFVFPISSMPAAVQVFTWLIPARYFMVIVRGIFLKGSTFADLWPQLWPMAVLCCLLLGASVATFKKRL